MSQDRATYLGSGDVAAILGLNPYRSPIQVWQAKTGAAHSDAPLNDAILNGIEMEPIIARRFTRYTGLAVRKARFVRDKLIPFFGATPDYLVVRQSSIVECKTAGWGTASKFGPEGSDQVPDEYLVQCQWQMAVTGKTLCYLALQLIGHHAIRTFQIPRSDEMIKTLRDRAQKWWEDYILADCPPPLSGHKSDSAYVSAQFPEAQPGEVVSADTDLEEIVLAYRHAKEVLTAAEMEAERLKNAIKLAMGEAETLESRYGQFRWLNFKSSTTTDFEGIVKELQVDPEVIARHLKTRSGGRQFREKWSE